MGGASKSTAAGTLAETPRIPVATATWRSGNTARSPLETARPNLVRCRGRRHAAQIDRSGPLPSPEDPTARLDEAAGCLNDIVSCGNGGSNRRAADQGHSVMRTAIGATRNQWPSISAVSPDRSTDDMPHRRGSAGRDKTSRRNLGSSSHEHGAQGAISKGRFDQCRRPASGVVRRHGDPARAAKPASTS